MIFLFIIAISRYMIVINPKFDLELCKIHTQIPENYQQSYRIVALSKMFNMEYSLQIDFTVVVSGDWE